MKKTATSVAGVAILCLLVLLVPARAAAQPSANCTENGEEQWTCTIVANNQPVTLPFTEQTGENETGYVLFCSYEGYTQETCNPENSYQSQYVLAFTNDGDTVATVYVNVNINADDPDFCNSNGWCIPQEDLAGDTCEVYDLCPGEANSNGDATFVDENGNTINIVPAAPSTPPSDTCAFGPYCDSAGIVFNAPAGTSIVLSASNSPNIGFTIPSSGTYAEIVLDNTTYSYVATVPGGSTTSGTVSTAAAYGVVTVTVT